MAPASYQTPSKKPATKNNEPGTAGKSVLNKAKPAAEEPAINSDMDDGHHSSVGSIDMEDLDLLEPSTNPAEEVLPTSVEHLTDSFKKPAVPNKKANSSTKETSAKAPAKQSVAASKKKGAKTAAEKETGPITKPETPKSKKRSAPVVDTDDAAADDEAATTGTPKKRRAGPSAKPRKVAASYEEADEADKMLWDYRHEGKSWSEVRNAWTDITGEETGSSTLPNRLERIKAIWFKLEAENEDILLQVKKAYEAKHETEKWAKIAEIMENEHGLPKYPAKALEKAFKEISKRNTAQGQDAAN